MATYIWPPSSPVSIAAQGSNATPTPNFSLQVAGENASGNLEPITVKSGQLQVDAAQSGNWDIRNVTGTVSLPTGAATDAKQDTGNTSLASIDGKLPALISSRVPVDVASLPLPTGAATESTLSALDAKVVTTANGVKVDGSAVTQPVSAASLPLPTGAATETTLSTLSGKVPSGLTVTSTRLLVDPSGVTQPVSASSLPLPTGAATESTLSTMSGKIPSNLTVTSTRLLVDGSGVTQPVSQTGKTRANAPVFNDYSSTGVTTSAYVQLVASTTSACTAVEVFNQSSSSLYFATGGAGAETNQFIIPPGGNGLVPIAISSSTRVSVKAVDVSATAGSLIVNFWG